MAIVAMAGTISAGNQQPDIGPKAASLMKNPAFRMSEGAGGFSLPNKASIQCGFSLGPLLHSAKFYFVSSLSGLSKPGKAAFLRAFSHVSDAEAAAPHVCGHKKPPARALSLQRRIVVKRPQLNPGNVV
jgi:hypothetical protein